MKYILALLGGFLVTLGVFACGGLTAIFFVNANPQPAHPLDADTGALWTNKAVRVSAGSQDLQRLPAVPQKADQEEQARNTSPEPHQAAGPTNTDPTVTASTAAATTAQTSPKTMAQTSPAPTAQPASATNAAHVEWCSEHYRSYNPADNSYNSFSGVRRRCVSPDLEGAPAAANSAMASAEAEPVDASTEGASGIAAASTGEMPGGYASPDHVQSCFDRYRSYRPEDNSYQPYGGGPRQQCE
jgi:hypothetical protein